MITAVICIVNVLFVFSFLCLLVAPGKSTEAMRSPFYHRNIAHRGLHTKDDKIPENSMAAFQKAIALGYGIELDIQFTKDEQIVVFHDYSLKRVCQVEGNVDDFTYEELKTFSISNTEERIPLFSDVLALVNGQVPLIIELKNGSKNTLLCERSYSLLKNYSGAYCIESFQPLIVAWFKQNAKSVLRGQLSAPPKELKGQLSFFPAFLLSRLITNFIAKPHFVAYHKEKKAFLVHLCDFLGAMKVVWTVRDTDDFHSLEKKNDTVIFEFYHPDVNY